MATNKITVELTNDKNRRDFLHNFKSWGVWFYEPLLGVTYYKCELPSEYQIVVEESPDTYITCGEGMQWTGRTNDKVWTYDHKRYHLIKQGESYCVDSQKMGEIISSVLRDMSGEYEIKTFGERD